MKIFRIFRGRRSVLALTYLAVSLLSGLLSDIVSPMFLFIMIPAVIAGAMSMVSITIFDEVAVDITTVDYAQFMSVMFASGLFGLCLSKLIQLRVMSTAFFILSAGSAFLLTCSLCILFVEWTKRGN